MGRATTLSTVLAICMLLLLQAISGASLLENCCVGSNGTTPRTSGWTHELTDGTCTVEMRDFTMVPDYTKVYACPYRGTNYDCPRCGNPGSYRPCGKYQLACYMELHTKCPGIHTGTSAYCHGCCLPTPPGHN